VTLPQPVEPTVASGEAPDRGLARDGSGPPAAVSGAIPSLCACGMPRIPTEDGPTLFGRDWHVAHRLRHCEAFPNLDDGIRRNLDQFIRWAS